MTKRKNNSLTWGDGKGLYQLDPVYWLEELREGYALIKRERGRLVSMHRFDTLKEALARYKENRG